MKLYLLRPKEDLPKGDDPWEPWYDKCFGFVICATDVKQARLIAHKNSGDEKCGEHCNVPWLKAKYSTCTELKAGNKAEVIINDFHSA